MNKLVTNESLDALIAEYVFGEPKPEVPSEKNGFDMFEFTYSKGGSWILDHEYTEGDIPVWHPISFSSSVESGFEVIYKVDELFSAVADLQQVHIKEGNQWVCSFLKRGTGKLLVKSLPCPNVAWAICEAALTLVRK